MAAGTAAMEIRKARMLYGRITIPVRACGANSNKWLHYKSWTDYMLKP